MTKNKKERKTQRKSELKPQIRTTKNKKERKTQRKSQLKPQIRTTKNKKERKTQRKSQLKPQIRTTYVTLYERPKTLEIPQSLLPKKLGVLFVCGTGTILI
jgi:hypothetical protein